MSLSLPHCAFKRVSIAVSLALLMLLLFSAGCLTSASPSSEVDTPHVYPVSKVISAPSELHAALHGFHTDFEILELAITGDLYTLSAQYGYAESDADIENIGRAYYASNPWIRGMVYYDAVGGRYSELPITFDVKYLPYMPTPSELDLKKSGGLMHEYGVFIPDYGYVNIFCKSVYDADGQYLGYVLIIYDSYIAMNLHPQLIGKERAYADCVCFAVDASGKILYSTMQESIGQKLTELSPFYNGQVLLRYTDSEYGAESYTTQSLYNYLNMPTEKITAWLKVRSFTGDRLTIYVVQEQNRPVPVAEHAYAYSTKAAVEDVTDLYIYAMQNGKYKAVWRVNEGYYTSDISILDMEGKVLASANPDIIGLNYLSNHAAYGKSYTEIAILTAQQGGGFIYYTLPVDATADTPAYQFSLAYVMPIGKQCFIMGHFTGDTDVIPKDFNLRNDVTKVSRGVLQQIHLLGIDAVVEMINGNRTAGAGMFAGNLVTNVSDVSVMNYSGYMSASIMHPELVGESATRLKDVYGGSITRRAIMLAKGGGGFQNALLPNPDKEGCVDLWMYHIEPINDGYYLQTGAVIGTFNDVLTPYLNSGQYETAG